MLLSSVFTIGNWHPGIGDPTLMGWFTVFSYYLTALICILSSFHNKNKEYMLWLFLGLFIGFLGLCKQYNLLSAITETGRIILRKNGLIKDRRIIQILFLLIFLPFIGIVSVQLIKKIENKISLTLKIVAIFTFYLSLFVLLRAVSLHQWETILGYSIFRLKINWLGELVGIYGILLGGIVNLCWRTS